MNTLLDWLKIRDNRTQLRDGELLLLVHDLDLNSIAVKASGVYPITASLVAHVGCLKQAKCIFHFNRFEHYKFVSILCCRS